MGEKNTLDLCGIDLDTHLLGNAPVAHEEDSEKKHKWFLMHNIYVGGQCELEIKDRRLRLGDQIRVPRLFQRSETTGTTRKGVLLPLSAPVVVAPETSRPCANQKKSS